jgi:hypothetical protein
MLKIPTNKYEMLIEESKILYENIKNNINIIEFNNLEVIFNNELKKDILNHLKILIDLLIINKDIQINLINLNNNKSIKDYMLFLINNYLNLIKITNPKIIKNKIVNELYLIINLKHLNINDLNQYYKLNDLDYFIYNNKYYKIDIINEIIKVISLLNIIVNENIVDNSDKFINFRNNLNCFLNCFENNIIDDYNDIKYYINDNDIDFNREIEFYKTLFNTNNLLF